MTAFDPCTCGEPHPHEVMRRHTVDGISIHLESDGKVLGLFGRSLAGVPVRRSRTAESHRAALAAGRMFMNAVGFYAAAELGALYADCCAAVAAGMDLREYRAKRDAEAAPVMISWTVVRADRDGRPVERHGRLPRLRWPGVAVVDYCGGRDSSGGRYEVIHREVIDGREVWRSSGVRFRRLDALHTHLRGIGTP